MPPCSVAAVSKLNDEQPLQMGDDTRWYRVHLPTGYAAKKNYPAVIVLHGAAGNAHLIEPVSGMSALADREHFIAIYPNGSSKISKDWTTWNGGECCGWAVKHKVDDIGFLDKLISTVEAQYAIDPRRVYLVGFSNGGMLAYRAAARLQDKIAAIGAVETSMAGDEAKLTQSMPTIMFHGTADKRVPIDGGKGIFAKFGQPVNEKPLSYAVKFWCNVNGCADAPKETAMPAVLASKAYPQIVRDEYANASGKPMVVVYKLIGGDHAWPGGSKCRAWGPKPAKDLNASEVMWKFFSQFQR